MYKHLMCKLHTTNEFWTHDFTLHPFNEEEVPFGLKLIDHKNFKLVTNGQK